MKKIILSLLVIFTISLKALDLEINNDTDKAVKVFAGGSDHWDACENSHYNLLDLIEPNKSKIFKIHTHHRNILKADENKFSVFLKASIFSGVELRDNKLVIKQNNFEYMINITGDNSDDGSSATLNLSSLIK